MEQVADSGVAERTVPRLGGIHHVGLTVSDVDASEVWYRRVLGLERVFVEAHHGGTGHTVVINRPGTALHLGLDHHEAHEGERFAEHRTGLDHLAIHVAERDELDAWTAHLDALGVSYSPITDCREPFPYATLVFRDPDNIQLELIWQ
jgi:catechol 2,3-dioxygenase-like lactoylglutathione lyase family enzyme